MPVLEISITNSHHLNSYHNFNHLCLDYSNLFLHYLIANFSYALHLLFYLGLCSILANPIDQDLYESFLFFPCMPELLYIY